MCSSSEPAASEHPQAVLLETARPCPIEALGDALAAALAIPRLEARARARTAGGIAHAGTRPEQAKTLVDALRERGVAAVCRDAASVPKPPRVLRASGVQLEPEGLYLLLAGGERKLLAFRELELALAWVLRGERRRRRVFEPSDLGRAALRFDDGLRLDTPLEDAALRLTDARARLRKREQAHVALGLDLLTDNLRVRLLIDRLHFQPPAGTPPHSAARWCALLERICEQAPQEAIAPETDAVRAGLLEPAWFHLPEERERYARWWLAMR